MITFNCQARKGERTGGGEGRIRKKEQGEVKGE